MGTNLIQNDAFLILVVDNDKSMRMLLRLALEQEGYQVVEASCGESCLATYQRRQPDLILLDALMPVMDGFTCCAQLQDISGDNHTPILMITVLDDPDSVDRAFEVGAIDYITKPIHWTVLRHRVRYLIQQSQLYRQLTEAKREVERLTSLVAQYEAER